jgi:HEAT repeat protein
MKSSEIDLFLKTLEGDYDDEAPWAAVNELQRRGARDVFDFAARWLRSSDLLKRARGADVLAQLGVGEGRTHAFPKETVALLLALLREEKEIRPLASAVVALGHLHDLRTLPTILSFVPHENAEIRHAVAFALGCFAEDSLAIAGLLTLTTDHDRDVRDWATFGLGVMSDADAPEIREALCRRLGDQFFDARQEAIAGLAKRQDRRVLPMLIAALETPEAATRVTAAAARAMLGLDEPPEGLRAGELVAALRDRYPDAGHYNACLSGAA